MVDITSPWVGVLVVLALLVASAFFSATEIALFSLPTEWTATTTDGEDRRMETLADLRADPHRLLVTLLVGNNLVNVALSAVVTLAVASALPPGLAVVVATLLASTAVLVFGEILPKSFGLGHAETWARSAARPLAAIQWVLYPVVTLFDVLTRRLGRAIGGARDIEQPYTD